MNLSHWSYFLYWASPIHVYASHNFTIKFGKGRDDTMTVGSICYFLFSSNFMTHILYDQFSLRSCDDMLSNSNRHITTYFLVTVLTLRCHDSLLPDLVTTSQLIFSGDHLNLWGCDNHKIWNLGESKPLICSLISLPKIWVHYSMIRCSMFLLKVCCQMLSVNTNRRSCHDLTFSSGPADWKLNSSCLCSNFLSEIKCKCRPLILTKDAIMN